MLAFITLLFVLLTPLALDAAPPIFKCSQKGSVTYQSDPCPVDGPRTVPTVEQLNAERLKLKQQQETASKLSGSVASEHRGLVSARPGAPPSSQTSQAKEPQPLAPAAQSNRRCDGRLYCSQMSSCEEAKFFLKHCPGVKMDGDGDGIPCEDQWCR
ncbi:excalibur calcium-binding domain-containing protein [Paucibacter sp. TC2R-5]|uniref:excalibur calcium-binding domain-containing protein n=1 Tax=Paucibacter sp. TC2R-5 TaxID=2893555 RepID=UPI0021E4ABE9|nr:excalibur calcium-binding domain-containing protein [Paucibacter sp. TC2R-5]MCV2360494.1 excalibur calcium-binding domain-containing protein [Paucibacter sp. TC2R-5]